MWCFNDRWRKFLCIPFLSAEVALAGNISEVETKEWPFEAQQALPGSGRSARDVKAVISDSEGRIWAGGSDGLYLFAGGDPKNVPFSPRTAKPENTAVIELATSPDCREIWFLTPCGPGWVDSQSGQIRYMPQSKNGIFQTFGFDGKGQLWIASDNGLHLFNQDSESHRLIDDSQEFHSIKEILADPNHPDCLWLATDYSKLIRYQNGETEQFTHEPDHKSKFQLNDRVQCVAISPDRNTLYFGGGNAVSTLNLDTNEVHTSRIAVDWATRHFKITAIVPEKTGTGLWIGSKRSSGFHFYDFQSDTFRNLGAHVRLETTRMGLGVEDMLIDSRQVVWLATEKDGLVINPIPTFSVEKYADWNPQGKNLYRGHCLSIFPIPGGSIVHTNRGICRLDYRNRKSHAITGPVKPEDQLIQGAMMLGDGNILATSGGALWRYPAGTDNHSIEKDLMPLVRFEETEGKRFARLAPSLDENGLLWISSRNQLYSYDVDTGELVDWEEITHWADSMEITDETLWIAAEHRLYRWNIQSKTMDLELETDLQYTHEIRPRQDNSGIYLATSEGLYTIGNEDAELELVGYEGESIKSFCYSGIPSQIWIVTQTGALRLFDLNSNQEIRYPGEIEFNRIEREFVRIERDANGSLLFGGWGCFYSVDESALTRSKFETAPRLLLSDISTNLPPDPAPHRIHIPSFNSSKPLRFEPDVSHVVFEANLLDYRFPEGSSIHYRVGERDWEVAPEGQFSIYHPGKGIHRIEIEGRDPAGNPAANHLLFDVQWDLHWWQQSWFIGAVLLLILGAGVGFHELRMRYVVRAKARLEKVHSELSSSESRFRNLFENSSDAIFVTDSDTNILLLNPAANLLLERSPNDIAKAPLNLARQFLDSDQLKTELKQSCAKGSMPETEYVLVTKTGNKIETTVTARAFDSDNGAEWQFRVRNVSKQKELEANIRTAQKMEAVGTLAGGLAHDFNNLLSPIIVHSQLATSEIENGNPGALHDAKDALSICGQAAKKAAGLVQDLLHFARKTDEGKTPVDLTAAIRNTIRFLKSSIGSNIQLKTDLPDHPAWTLCSPQRLEQALMNIGVNASHAIGIENGALTFSVKSISDRDPESIAGSDPREFWEVSITDTGCGMDEETVSRIYEPFFTTKCVDKGTGLGMSMVHAFIAETGGTIRIESKINKGTRVIFQFPSHELLDDPDIASGHIPLEPTLTPVSPRHPSLKVMCVDDDPLVLKATTKILEKKGCEIQSFQDSTKALQALEADPGCVDVVVTDQMMPKMTGLEFARKIRKQQPGLPIVLLTGYSDLLSDRDSAGDCIDVIHVKPLDYDVLEETLISLTSSDVAIGEEVALSA